MKSSRSLWLMILATTGYCGDAVANNTMENKIDDCARPTVEKVEIPNTVWQPEPNAEQVPLWPSDAYIESPETNGNPEMIGSGSPLIAGRTWNWATNISRPTMTIYPPQGKNSGAAMLVLPGGGYVAVAMDLEGTEICDWITEHGVTCVVLKYRAPQVWGRNDAGARTPPEGKLLPLEDAQRAIGLLRHNAASYNIDPDKVGVIGFSAGAHLAAAVSNADQRRYDSVDSADEKSSRPDFAIVMYPGKFLEDRWPQSDLKLAPWMDVSASAPPTLLVHAMNDRSNHVSNSMAYALALNEAGVPVDMRIFAEGCHAFGLRPTSDPITTQWPGQAIQWLRNIDIL
ncbi:MAG: alpha/beta hydrolase fold domain-containing protein [Alphaproteobacteria bacterium]|nr:alpha/beta hydrolase fold domain-containing protein [Alphaproteobacteria bacterium]